MSSSTYWSSFVNSKATLLFLSPALLSSIMKISIKILIVHPLIQIPIHPHPALFSSCEHALCMTNWQLLIQLSYSYFFNILPMRPQNGSYIDLRFGLDYSSNYYLKKCTVYLEVSKNYIRSSLPPKTHCVHTMLGRTNQGPRLQLPMSHCYPLCSLHTVIGQVLSNGGCNKQWKHQTEY